MHNIMRYLDKRKLDWFVADKGLYVSAAEDQNDKTEGISDHTFLSAHLEKSVLGIDPKLLRDMDELVHGLQQFSRERKTFSAAGTLELRKPEICGRDISYRSQQPCSAGP
ncbi:hypothetical protein V2K54_13395 [Pseudomonas alliivorans]|uniref:hypothetical protein n=1 Tax=Pseudomonas syringae TaxID=317 RepID=UPI001F49126D|nr:hypothetical protein [Pseudomonas syringae]MEE4957047.1 hypothetical protein [Pseudomonas alliivorans]MCF5734847.1 hypothetical protein [Pseudomonas syringae]MCF5742774.1 hypothetical protein [Pseudomonas syringae]MCF5753113.1 hypothetical protein [Pseudomonas syringae]MCF5758080.1 hypothetical protein [Pseudomonas syringae]